MKKIICLALSLIMTLGLLSPIKTHADDELYYELPLDYIHEIEAGSWKCNQAENHQVKKLVKGKNIYSNWSNIKSVKTK